MTARDFCYWLQGCFELNRPTQLDEGQVKMIRDHLNLVFIHEIDSPDPTGVLQATHDGKKILTEDDKKDLEKKIEQASKVRPKPTLYRC